MNTDALVVEAKARITWGEEPTSVRIYLISCGLPAENAGEIVQALVAERSAELRMKGLINTCVWGTILCGCVVFVSYQYYHLQEHFRARQGKGMFVVGFIGLFALWKLINGLTTLIRPKSDTQAISDVISE